MNTIDLTSACISHAKLSLFLERKQLSVDVSNNSTWFNRDTGGSIEFTIYGSPLPSLTCTQNRTRKIVLSCSKTQMRSLLYEEKSKPCISISGKHVLISRASQTGKVKLLIAKLKLETDNGRLDCLLRNPYDKNHFYLDVNVKGSLLLVLFCEQHCQWL